jgi:acyl carrier protein
MLIKVMFEIKFLKKLEKELEKKIDIKKNFKQNDLDSLDIFTVISQFEDYYKIKLKDEDFKKIKNFENLKKKNN